MTGDFATPSAIKERIRTEARAALSRMTPAERRSADLRISARLDRFVVDRGATWVFGYLALRDEVRLDLVLAGVAERGREVWLPRVLDGTLWLGRWRPAAQLVRDDENVLAPAHALFPGWPSGPGVILVPGRAFDRSGGRVGRGRGYYDRFLSRPAGGVIVVGVAYDCQIVERVPREIHDHDVDFVVTESSTFGVDREPARLEQDRRGDRGDR